MKVQTMLMMRNVKSLQLLETQQVTLFIMAGNYHRGNGRNLVQNNAVLGF